MAITLVGSSSGYVYTDAGGSITFPSGGAAGDIAILTLWHYENETSAVTISNMTGWTAIYSTSSFSVGGAMNVAHRSYYVRRGGSDPSLVVPASSPTSSYKLYSCTLWRGCVSSGNPVHAYGINNKTYNDTSLVWSAPSVTTTLTNTRNIVTHMYRTGDKAGPWSASTPSGYTEHLDFYQSSLRAAMATSSKAVADAGSTGEATTTWTVPADDTIYQLRRIGAVTINLQEATAASSNPPIISYIGM